MKVSVIKQNKVGQGIGGFDLAVTKCKKTWKLADGTWIHRIALGDETGEILADINIGTYTPIRNGEVIHAIVAEVQAVDPESQALGDKKLWIDQFTKVSQGSEPEIYQEEEYEENPF